MNDWEVLQRVLRERRSIRVFRSDPVSDDDVLRLLDAARQAPSAGNRQPFRWMVVRHEKTKRQMAEAVREQVDERMKRFRPDLVDEVDVYGGQLTSFAEAPILIVPVFAAARSSGASSSPGDTTELSLDSTLRDNLFSVAAAVTQMLLAASTLGLGACWMTGPLLAEERLSTVLGIPAGWRLAGIIPVGVPGETPPSPHRRPLGRLVLPEPEAAELDELSQLGGP